MQDIENERTANGVIILLKRIVLNFLILLYASDSLHPLPLFNALKTVKYSSCYDTLSRQRLVMDFTTLCVIKTCFPAKSRGVRTTRQ